MAKIFVTGATGFIGKRLIVQLLQQGHTVFALVRIRGVEVLSEKSDRLHLVYADLGVQNEIEGLPSDIDVAFYLMHSMSDSSKDLLQIERAVACHFIDVVKKTHIKQIIYLGGICNSPVPSPHFAARRIVEECLMESGIPTTIFRASIIIGSGSASFEIIRDLVEKLPVMIAPRWVSNLCQPIAVQDVIFYLQNAILNEKTYNKTFDIGGPDVLTFKQALLEFARIRNLKRYIISVPVLTPRLSSYWLVFITSVRFSLASYLVESMKCNSRCTEQAIHDVIPHSCLSYSEAIQRAFQRISQNEVTSTWMDSWDVADLAPDIQKYVQVPEDAVLYNRQIVPIGDTVAKTIDRIWAIGGRTGCYAYDWGGSLKGIVDKMLGGVGMNRGRRHPCEIRVGESIDFWRVLKADREGGCLILYAEMKLPGEAWLEFKIVNDTLVQTATFRPRGLLGRLYWYMLVPIHHFIFGKMARRLAG